MTPSWLVVPLPDPGDIWSSFCVTVRNVIQSRPAAQLKRTSALTEVAPSVLYCSIRVAAVARMRGVAD